MSADDTAVLARATSTFFYTFLISLLRGPHGANDESVMFGYCYRALGGIGRPGTCRVNIDDFYSMWHVEGRRLTGAVLLSIVGAVKGDERRSAGA